MKEIKLTGRERAAIKAIDFSTGCTGEEIFERTRIERDDLREMLSGLMDTGYVEAFDERGAPITTHITAEQFDAIRFEVNPSYVGQLKEALRR